MDRDREAQLQRDRGRDDRDRDRARALALDLDLDRRDFAARFTAAAAAAQQNPATVHHHHHQQHSSPYNYYHQQQQQAQQHYLPPRHTTHRPPQPRSAPQSIGGSGSMSISSMLGTDVKTERDRAPPTARTTDSHDPDWREAAEQGRAPYTMQQQQQKQQRERDPDDELRARERERDRDRDRDRFSGPMSRPSQLQQQQQQQQPPLPAPAYDRRQASGNAFEPLGLGAMFQERDRDRDTRDRDRDRYLLGTALQRPSSQPPQLHPPPGFLRDHHARQQFPAHPPPPPQPHHGAGLSASTSVSDTPISAGRRRPSSPPGRGAHPMSVAPARPTGSRRLRSPTTSYAPTPAVDEKGVGRDGEAARDRAPPAAFPPTTGPARPAGRLGGGSGTGFGFVGRSRERDREREREEQARFGAQIIELEAGRDRARWLQQQQQMQQMQTQPHPGSTPYAGPGDRAGDFGFGNYAMGLGMGYPAPGAGRGRPGPPEEGGLPLESGRRMPMPKSSLAGAPAPLEDPSSSALPPLARPVPPNGRWYDYERERRPADPRSLPRPATTEPGRGPADPAMAPRDASLSPPNATRSLASPVEPVYASAEKRSLPSLERLPVPYPHPGGLPELPPAPLAHHHHRLPPPPGLPPHVAHQPHRASAQELLHRPLSTGATPQGPTTTAATITTTTTTTAHSTSVPPTSTTTTTLPHSSAPTNGRPTITPHQSFAIPAPPSITSNVNPGPPGRASPIPQAVQGAQAQSGLSALGLGASSVSDDVKGELGRVFVGIGSGVGAGGRGASASPGAPGAAAALRRAAAAAGNVNGNVQAPTSAPTGAAQAAAEESKRLAAALAGGAGGAPPTAYDVPRHRQRMLEEDAGAPPEDGRREPTNATAAVAAALERGRKRAHPQAQTQAQQRYAGGGHPSRHPGQYPPHPPPGVVPAEGLPMTTAPGPGAYRQPSAPSDPAAQYHMRNYGGYPQYTGPPSGRGIPGQPIHPGAPLRYPSSSRAPEPPYMPLQQQYAYPQHPHPPPSTLAPPLQPPVPEPPHEYTTSVNLKPLLESVAHRPRKHLGSTLYNPKVNAPSLRSSSALYQSVYSYDKFGYTSTPRPLPRFYGHENCTFDVRVPRWFLADARREEVCHRRALWGTGVYTDDSDPLAAAMHSGFVRGCWGEEVDAGMLDLMVKPGHGHAPKTEGDTVGEEVTPVRKESGNGKKSTSGNGNGNEGDKFKASSGSTALEISPDKARRPTPSPLALGSNQTTAGRQPHLPPLPVQGKDLRITLLILPPLTRYDASVMYGIKSRPWGDTHDGMSFQVLRIDWVDENVESRGQERGGLARRKRLRYMMENGRIWTAKPGSKDEEQARKRLQLMRRSGASMNGDLGQGTSVSKAVEAS